MEKKSAFVDVDVFFITMGGMKTQKNYLLRLGLLKRKYKYEIKRKNMKKPMKTELFKQAIEEFKLIFKEEFGIELSDQDATEKAEGLLQLFDCLTRLKEV